MRWLGRWGLRATGPVVLVFLLVRVVDYGELGDIVRELQLLWALAAVGTVQLIILFRSLRWMEIHEASGLPRAPLTYQLRLTYATVLATLVLPQILNPFSRLVLLLQDGYQASRAAVAAVLEKGLDFVAFVVFGLLGSIVLASTFGALVWWAVGASVLMLVLSVGVYAARSQLGRLISALIPKLPGAGDGVSDDRLGALREIGSLNARTLVRFLLWSLLVALTQATTLYFLSRSLGVGLSYPFVVALWGVVALTMLLPLSVNGLGTREGILVVAFSAADKSADAAVALGLLVLIVVAIGSSPGAIEWLRRFFASTGRTASAGTQETAAVAVSSSAPPQGERSR
jgi:uncharacterized membrane protein YbhN (UPF0104 family)